ncbi:MAG: hypothetical protein PVG39_00845 [Desulfobacteraceae bacterium]|jgi:hypothetical protein
MAYDPMSNADYPNLINLTKTMDPDGSIADVGELLTQYNPILEDIPLVEGNLPTGHRVTVRNGLPTPVWRKFYQGVTPTKGKTTQVDDTIGMCEDYGEVDKDLADLNGNTSEFRLQEDTAHIEGMSQELASTIFYGDTDVDPEKFNGLAPRYDAIGDPADKPTAQTNSAYLKHILNAGGTTADVQTSVWYVVWAPQTVFGIYPKGSKVGIQSRDLGEQTLFDSDGGRFQGYRTHYQVKQGLCVKDWRYIVRIANVELGDMLDATAQKTLLQMMNKARYTVPLSGIGRGVFYCSPAVLAMLDDAAVFKSNAALGWRDVFGDGKEMTTYRGIPIRACNAILETEAVLT